MRQETSIRAIQGRGFGAMAVAALAVAALLIAAGPARANNEFQNGFEDQLGRIAAYGAVNLGLQVLSGGYYPVVPVVPVVQASYYGPSYGSYYGPRKVVVRYPKAYRHGRHCNSRYDRAPSHGYYGNDYGYNHGNQYNNDYDNDRGHRSHGKKYRGERGRGW